MAVVSWSSLAAICSCGSALPVVIAAEPICFRTATGGTDGSSDATLAAAMRHVVAPVDKSNEAEEPEKRFHLEFACLAFQQLITEELASCPQRANLFKAKIRDVFATNVLFKLHVKG